MPTLLPYFLSAIMTRLFGRVICRSRRVPSGDARRSSVLRGCSVRLRAFRGLGATYSAWSNRAAGVRAATRPGTAATRFASTRPPIPTATIAVAGTVGCGTAEIVRANRVQSQRPVTMPAGIPTTVPMRATTVACAATVAASWRLVYPSVFRSASSRRRRRGRRR